MEEALESLGLTKNDAKVCSALLRFGTLKVGELENTTGLHRRNIHDALHRLQHRGFVGSFVKNGKRHFQITDIVHIRSAFEGQKKKIEQALPELDAFPKEQKIPSIQILTGKEGLRRLLDDEVKEPTSTYVISTAHFEETIWDYFETGWHPVLRGKNKLKILFIQRDRALGKRAAQYAWTEVRYLPDSYASAVGIEVYRDVACILMDDIIIQVRDREIAKRFKHFFDLLWKNGKRHNDLHI